MITADKGLGATVRKGFRVLLTACAVIAGSIAPTASASAQQTDSELPVPVAPLRSVGAQTVPLGTSVILEFIDPVNSRSSKVGEKVRLSVAQALEWNGQVVIPEGAPAIGEIIHIAKARAGGKAGELIIAARYIEWGNRQIPLKGFRFGAVGDSRVVESFVLSTVVAAPLGFLVAGGEVEVKPGTRGHAKLKEDIPVASSGNAEQITRPEP